MHTPTDLPLVTFVSPCYNHEKYVIQSLESIKNQTYPNIQHIIIDDASTDNSVKLIEEWIRENNYECMFIKHHQNKGISYTLNESIALAKGEYWTSSATDDYVHPSRTEEFVKYMHENPVDMVISDMQIVNDFGEEVPCNGTLSFLNERTLHHPNFNIEKIGSYESLLFDNYIPGSLMIKTSVFNKIGTFNESYSIEDWDMWLRISAHYKIGFIDQNLAFYRRHITNSMKVLPAEIRRNAMFNTFLNQKEYCYSNKRKKLFHRAYQHHFNNYYNPFKYPASSLLFHRINIFIFLRAVAGKIKNVIKNFF